MMPRLGRLVWLAYAALLGVAQASLAFAWAVHAHGGSSSSYGGSSGHERAPGMRHALALQPTPSQQQLMAAGAAGAGSSSSGAPYCQRCRLSMSASASASALTAAAPPPAGAARLQPATTVRLCKAIIRGARGGGMGFKARSKAVRADGEEPLLAATKGRGRTALKASASSSFEQQPPSQQQQQQQQRGRGQEWEDESEGEGALLLPERPKQELSSTIAILAAGAAVTALAAVMPAGLQPVRFVCVASRLMTRLVVWFKFRRTDLTIPPVPQPP
jgi:hypothetical protein